jgi:predicted small lipoprotein YifL
MRRALPLFFVLTFLLALTACGSAGPGAALKDLVPAEANLIAQVQVSEILQDPDLATLYDQTPKNPGDPQTFQELLVQTQEETGIDFRQFNTAILFGDITRDNEYFGVIAQGRSTRSSFSRRCRSKASLPLRP